MTIIHSPSVVKKFVSSSRISVLEQRIAKNSMEAKKKVNPDTTLHNNSNIHTIAMSQILKKVKIIPIHYVNNVLRFARIVLSKITKVAG